MAHEITEHADGRAEVFTAGESPWHKLGANVEQAQTWEQAVKLAHLDWKVEKLPLQSADGRKAPGIFGLYRADNKNFLGRAGEDYDIIQNEKAFDWVDSILAAEKGAHYVSAGSLFGGSTMWCLAAIPETLRIVGTDDITKNYLLFVDYRNVGKSAIVKNVQERVVCHNTLSVALSEESKVLSIPHKKVEERLKQAKLVLEAVKGQTRDVGKVMNLLAKTKLKSANIAAILGEMFPKLETSIVQQNKARDILELFEDNDKNAFPQEAGTAYALLNAATNFADHKASFRQADETETEAKARARAALFGAGEAFKFATLVSIVTTLSKQNLLSVSEKELQAIGVY